MGRGEWRQGRPAEEKRRVVRPARPAPARETIPSWTGRAYLFPEWPSLREHPQAPGDSPDSRPHTRALQRDGGEEAPDESKPGRELPDAP